MFITTEMETGHKTGELRPWHLADIAVPGDSEKRVRCLEQEVCTISYYIITVGVEITYLRSHEKVRVQWKSLKISMMSPTG